MKPTRRPDEVRRKRIMKSPSFSWPAGRPGPDQADAKKAGEPAGRGLAWTACRRPDQAKARTGPAGLLRPLAWTPSMCSPDAVDVPLSVLHMYCINLNMELFKDVAKSRRRKYFVDGRIASLNLGCGPASIISPPGSVLRSKGRGIVTLHINAEDFT
jgi:hypothetical protein